MSRHGPETIADLAEFLAHAYALETESAQRYEELADNMEVHNNPGAAELFRKLWELGEQHAREVLERTAGLELPQIPPWDFKWNCPDGPENACMDDAHYLMHEQEALELALHNETRGQEFYAVVAQQSPDPEVRGIAAQIAEEEAAHVEMIRKWINDLPPDRKVPRQEDLDPPNIPE